MHEAAPPPGRGILRDLVILSYRAQHTVSGLSAGLVRPQLLASGPDVRVQEVIQELQKPRLRAGRVTDRDFRPLLLPLLDWPTSATPPRPHLLANPSTAPGSSGPMPPDSRPPRNASRYRMKQILVRVLPAFSPPGHKQVAGPVVGRRPRVF